VSRTPRTTQPLEEQFPDDKATVEWLRAQKQSSQNTYKSYWQWFLEYIQMNGDQILVDRKQDKSHKWEIELLKFRNWSLSHICGVHKRPLSENGAKTACGVVRGFFAHHYQDLKIRRNDSAKIKQANRVYQDYRLSKEDILRMSVVADLRDRYILVLGKSLGLRASDFIKLKVGDFTCLNLDAEPPISMGRLDTTKESIPAYPFLDSDAASIVKAFLESLNISDQHIRILQIKKNELTNVLKRLADKANIQLGNKQLRFHCLRKFLIDRLSAVTSESKWKQVVGKQIDERAYVSEAELREAYRRVMPETCFSNNNRRSIAIEQLEKENKELKETIKGLQSRIEEFQSQLNKAVNDFEDRIIWLENKAAKKEKIKFT